MILNYHSKIRMILSGCKVSLLMAAMIPSLSFAGDYDRRDYGYWIDDDGDCQNTRQEILVRDSLVSVSFVGDKNCRVKSGLWFCPYTGLYFTDPRRLDIDHIVPLGEAHKSGAAAFSPDKKEAFRNDPKNLVAVSAGANRSKGQRDPNYWMPTNRLFWFDYSILWARTKIRWGLSFDDDERAKIDCLLSDRKHNCQ